MTIISSDYSLFGQDVTYTPKSTKVPVAVSGIVTEMHDGEEQADFVRHNGEIRVQMSEVAARPDYQDKFAIIDGAGNSQDWHIVPEGVRERQALIGFAGEWVCKISRDERPIWG